MAILSAFNWSEVEVIGLTTLFGNVPVSMATQNALILRDLAAKMDPAGASDSFSDAVICMHVCSGSPT